MKKVLAAGLTLCLLMGITACEQRSNDKTQTNSTTTSTSESTSQSTQSKLTQAQPSESISSNEEQASNGKYDSAALVASVNDIIQQYKDGTVDTEIGAPGASAPDFDKMPEDLEFSDVKDESNFLSIKPIEGWETKFIVELECSGDYVMHMRIDTADNYKVTSVIFFG